MSVDTLQAKIRKKKNPTVLAMDIRGDMLPEEILAQARQGGAAALAEAIANFGTDILKAVAAVVPAVKFNTAYYEALGPDGLKALQALCTAASELGYYVMLETLRSDQADTAALYARACFGDPDGGDGQEPLYRADALCIGAFSGSDGVRPYLDHCRCGDKSLFVLARTPNKSAREVQDLLSGDRVIHTVMTDLAMRWSTGLFAKSGYSELGVILGAPAATLRDLRQRYDRLFFLVPGYGMPGYGAKDVQYAFDKFGHGAVIEAPASLLAAWKDPAAAGAGPAEACRAAVEKMRGELARHVTVI